MTPYEAAHVVARQLAADAIRGNLQRGNLAEYDWRRVQQLAKAFATPADPGELAEAWEVLGKRAEAS